MRLQGSPRAHLGMSVVELLVSLALTSVVLLGAAVVAVEVSRASATAGGRDPAVGGPTDVALELVCRDWRQAAAAPPREGDWRADSRTLVLRLVGGQRVVYALDDDRLLRFEAEEGEPDLSLRLVTPDVLFVEFTRRGGMLQLTLRRRDEPVRSAVALARNQVHGAAP